MTAASRVKTPQMASNSEDITQLLRQQTAESFQKYIETSSDGLGESSFLLLQYPVEYLIEYTRVLGRVSK